jgi:hypothetical protein
MFANLPQCVSLSEPDVQTQLVVERFEEAQLALLLRSTARHYFQPRQPATHLVMKFRSFCVELAAEMHAASPGTAALFLYRDIERVVASGMRAFRYAGAPLEKFDRLHRTRWGYPLLWANIALVRGLAARLFPAMTRFTSAELARMGPIGLLAIAWVSAMERCAKLLAANMQIMPIHYDDLVARPEFVANQIAEHCGLNAQDIPQMLTAVDDDSQADSVVERSRQQRFDLTDDDRRIIGDVLARSDIIDSGDFRLPQTAGTAAA